MNVRNNQNFEKREKFHPKRCQTVIEFLSKKLCTLPSLFDVQRTSTTKFFKEYRYAISIIISFEDLCYQRSNHTKTEQVGAKYLSTNCSGPHTHPDPFHCQSSFRSVPIPKKKMFQRSINISRVEFA